MSFHAKFLFLVAIVCICNANDSTWRRNYRASPNEQVHSNHSEIMSQLRAMELTDGDQLRRLDSIEDKLMKFNSSAMDHLSSILMMQKHTSSQLHTEVDKIRTETRMSIGNLKADPHNIFARQSDLPPADKISDSDKLESIAILLHSTRSAVAVIEKTLSQFETSLAKLTQLTRRRVSTGRHRQQPQYPQLYGPPPSPEYDSAEPSSCAEASLPQTGIQKILLRPQSEPFYVHCESADKGGWTVIQNRFDGSTNFNRPWEEYKNGFGNLAGEFFIGLEKLHALTASALHELRIVLVDFKDNTRTASYSLFAIGGEKEFYPLQILGSYSGDAGDSLRYQAGNKFSTFDNDNDGWVEGNCAHAHTGAWWYAACEESNLNGQYLREPNPEKNSQGMYWGTFGGALSSLKAVQMKIRPINQGVSAE